MNEAIVSRTLELALAIQRIPAPTFSEAERAAYVAKRWHAEGFTEISSDEVGNVYVRLPGAGRAAPVVISAHLDSVFPLSTPLQAVCTSDQITAPGIGDNALGVAGLFAVAWLRQGCPPLPGDLWLVANVAEEGLGDLRGMKAVVKRFGAAPSAYLVLEGMALGQIFHRGLAVKRYRIRVQTEGGHAWVDFGRPSAIQELARLIAAITALPLPHSPRTTSNVGMISGGTSVNTIAAEASLELDLRSEESETLERLAAQVETFVAGANRPGVSVTAEVIGKRPGGAISESHPLVQLAKRCLAAQNITPCCNIGSTDANIPLSRGLPAICIGLTTGSGAHTTHETIQIGPLRQGLAQLEMLVNGLYENLSPMLKVSN